MKINGETKLIGFFGSTYKTSKMYAMYNAAIKALGLNFIYIPFVVKDLREALEGVRNLGIAAIGITIPYKITIIKYLDGLDKDAKRIGAVNVVVNKNGKLIGGNTDGKGAIRALKEKVTIKNKNVVILGAGGAARSIAFSIKDKEGNISILNRTREKAKELAKTLGGRTKYGNFSLLKKGVKDADILINTTPVGMADTPYEGKSLIPKNLLKKEMTVMEIISKPRETKLVQDAKRAGCKIVYGYRMLLWQGVDKFKMYTGVEPPIKVMEKAMEKIK